MLVTDISTPWSTVLYAHTLHTQSGMVQYSAHNLYNWHNLLMHAWYWLQVNCLHVHKQLQLLLLLWFLHLFTLKPLHQPNPASFGLPGLICASPPKRYSRLLPRQKCSITLNISAGLVRSPYSGSSVTITSRSTLAWMKSPSWFLFTVPLMPIKQCSCVLTNGKGQHKCEHTRLCMLHRMTVGVSVSGKSQSITYQ